MIAIYIVYEQLPCPARKIMKKPVELPVNTVLASFPGEKKGKVSEEQTHRKKEITEKIPAKKLPKPVFHLTGAVPAVLS